jgi:hypothetical protein
MSVAAAAAAPVAAVTEGMGEVRGTSSSSSLADKHVGEKGWLRDNIDKEGTSHRPC